MNREGQILLCCARTEFDAISRERLEKLVSYGNIDWSLLLQFAEKHRLSPLLYHGLRIVYAEKPAKDFFCRLKGKYFANLQRNFILTKELLRLLSLFQQHSIRVIAYKGTLLASSIYGKISLRQVWDIDLLVHARDVVQSQELLNTEGYVVKESFDHESCFYNKHREIEIDLHWGLTPNYFPVTIDFDFYWIRIETINLSGTAVPTFCAEDLLLILCMQIAKDSWERQQRLEHLIKVCDIAELIRNRPAIDWEQVLKQARTMGVERILLFALSLTDKLLAPPIPEPIQTLTDEDKTARMLADYVCRELFSEQDKSFAPPENSLLDVKLRIRQLIFYMRIRERFQDKILYILEILRTTPLMIK